MQTILFQGDSITDVCRNRNEENAANTMGNGYPLLIKAKLGCDCPGAYTFINRGVSGDRVVDVYARMKRDIIGHKPDCLSVLLGINDVWHDLAKEPNGVAADKFERVYDWLLSEVKQALPGIRILILEPFVLKGTATWSEVNPDLWAFFAKEVPLRAAAALRVCEKNGCEFVPLQKILDEKAAATDPALWLRDGVHPTEAGHELIAREWLKVFCK